MAAVCFRGLQVSGEYRHCTIWVTFGPELDHLHSQDLFPLVELNSADFAVFRFHPSIYSPRELLRKDRRGVTSSRRRLGACREPLRPHWTGSGASLLPVVLCPVGGTELLMTVCSGFWGRAGRVVLSFPSLRLYDGEENG